MEELIICPWCQSVTSVPEDVNEHHCSSCRNIIKEEDIEESEKEEK